MNKNYSTSIEPKRCIYIKHSLIFNILKSSPARPGLELELSITNNGIITCHCLFKRIILQSALKALKMLITLDFSISPLKT